MASWPSDPPGLRAILAPMTVSSRLPAFVLLGLVLVVAALLVAGYGVAVGVGVIAGLILGVAVVLAFLAMNPRSGSFVSWGSSGRSPDAPGVAFLEHHGRDAMRVAGVDAGALWRVIALGDVVEAGGARVELVALEIRVDGAIATVVAHTRPPVGPAGHVMEVSVADDVGTTYVAAGQGSGGSGPGATRHEVRLSPAPPGGARMLTLRIEAFLDPFPRVAAQLRGPWEFHIAI
jgi:hypothetical protein